MKLTGNYGLKKPDGTDLVEIEDINGNMDVLDGALAGKLDKAGTAKNAETVNGHLVNSDVPAGAKFTDTVYSHPGSGASAGTYRSVAVNAQGHVTKGSNPILDVSQGGTGASTAENARYNLGVNLWDMGGATRVNPVFDGSISMGRTLGYNIGEKSVAMGSYVAASGSGSVAMGYSVVAEETGSVAIGSQAHAAEWCSTAIGGNVKAYGLGSTAMGMNTTTRGKGAVAMGSGNAANSDYSVSFGCSVSADRMGQMAIGKFNQYNIQDAFLIGNGTSSSDRSNLFEVRDTTVDEDVVQVNGRRLPNMGMKTLWTGAAERAVGITLPDSIFYNGGKSCLLLVNAYNGLAGSSQGVGLGSLGSGVKANVNMSVIVGVNLGTFSLDYNPIYDGGWTWTGPEQYSLLDGKYCGGLYVNVNKSASKKTLSIYSDYLAVDSGYAYKSFLTSISAFIL